MSSYIASFTFLYWIKPYMFVIVKSRTSIGRAVIVGDMSMTYCKMNLTGLGM